MIDICQRSMQDLHISQQIIYDINKMAKLRKKRTSIERLNSFPVRRPVVAFTSVPIAINRHRENLAQLLKIDQLFDCLYRRIESVLLYDKKILTGLQGHVDHVFTIDLFNGHWFFN